MIPDTVAGLVWAADCLRWRGKVLTGKRRHWCADYDGLPVDETTPEWPCACAKELEEKEKMTNADTIAPAVEVLPPVEPWASLPAGEWAIVELFGHTTLVGRVLEVERFGAKMLAIQPLFKGALLTEVLHGGGAIYRFTQCSARVAWERQPKHEYNLPAAIQAIIPPAMLAAPADSAMDDVERCIAGGGCQTEAECRARADCAMPF